MQIDRVCPRGHGELVQTYAGCHDDDPECECETIEGCATCTYQHFSTCDNATPRDIGEPQDGDTWERSDGTLHLYDATRGDWIKVPA
jgi:hypothetical protein